VSDELRYDGDTAIITGSGGGLGREYALLLAARGANVVVNDVDADAAGAVVDEIRREGGLAHACATSVATPSGADELVGTALVEFGSVQIVINNAGNLRDKSFAKMDRDDLTAVIAVHLEGTFNVTRAAWDHLRAQNYGRVLATSSNSGILGNFGQSNYAAAKMGIVGLINVLAIEGAKYGIAANVIAPYARTPMTQNLLAPDVREALDPARVAPAAAWLVHRDCTSSGEVFSVGGGRVARYFQGLTAGYVNPDVSVEDVRDHWDAVRDTTAFSVPEHSKDVLAELMARLRVRGDR